MQVGIIGLGAVGGTLARWFEKNTNHIIKKVDPAKGFKDSLSGCSAIFVAVPVYSTNYGQDRSILFEAVKHAKTFSNYVFIRSTVLPGTNDDLGTIALPEFLTERRADLDMDRLPLLVGSCEASFMDALFPNKEKIYMSNCEAELAKFTHNCFGAMKVCYFNMIYDVCRGVGADFEKVKQGAMLTGFIESHHTHVPGPDTFRGFGGKCFPENIKAFSKFLTLALHMKNEGSFFEAIELLNKTHRLSHAAKALESTL